MSGYLLPFFELNIWGHLPTTIIVLVAINQPFTLWMLHSFLKAIPKDLAESGIVDGCTRCQAFRLAIMPVMWPGPDHDRAVQLPSGYRLPGDGTSADPGERHLGAQHQLVPRHSAKLTRTKGSEAR